MKPKNKKHPKKTMAEISAGYEKFIEGKEINPDGKEVFERALKKASVKKPRSTK